MVQFVALDVDLLFEQRVQHDRRCSAIFQLPDIRDLPANRRSRSHERALQVESEIFRRKVSHCPLPCLRPCLPPVSFQMYLSSETVGAFESSVNGFFPSRASFGL